MPEILLLLPPPASQHNTLELQAFFKTDAETQTQVCMFAQLVFVPTEASLQYCFQFILILLASHEPERSLLFVLETFHGLVSISISIFCTLSFPVLFYDGIV